MWRKERGGEWKTGTKPWSPLSMRHRCQSQEGFGVQLLSHLSQASVKGDKTAGVPQMDYTEAHTDKFLKLYRVIKLLLTECVVAGRVVVEKGGEEKN